MTTDVLAVGDVHHRLGGRLHDRHRRRPGRRGPGRADPGARPAIGNEAPKINDALTEAVHNTAPLGALSTTIEHATIIIAGLQRGRTRLGG